MCFGCPMDRQASCQNTCCFSDDTCTRSWTAPADNSWPNPVCNAECYTPSGGLEFADALDCGSIPQGLISSSGQARADELESGLDAIIMWMLICSGVCL